MDTILSIICMVLNTVCVAFLCFHFDKWIRRIERKIDSVRRKQSILNVNQLTWLRQALIREERYEEVKKIDEAIKEEMKSIEDGNR